MIPGLARSFSLEPSKHKGVLAPEIGPALRRRGPTVVSSPVQPEAMMVATVLLAALPRAVGVYAGALRAPAFAAARGGQLLSPLRAAVSGAHSRSLSKIAAKTRDDMRNIAIVAHVDHGKTSLVDAMLQSAKAISGNIGKDDRLMDSNDQVRSSAPQPARPYGAPPRPAHRGCGACPRAAAPRAGVRVPCPRTRLASARLLEHC
jgi:hypothetical protein